MSEMPDFDELLHDDPLALLAMAIKDASNDVRPFLAINKLDPTKRCLVVQCGRLYMMVGHHPEMGYGLFHQGAERPISPHPADGQVPNELCEDVSSAMASIFKYLKVPRPPRL